LDLQTSDLWTFRLQTFGPSDFFIIFATVIDGGQICADCNHGKKC